MVVYHLKFTSFSIQKGNGRSHARFRNESKSRSAERLRRLSSETFTLESLKSLLLTFYLMRSELVTTRTLLAAMAAAAYNGDIKPAAAIGKPITL